MNRSTWQLISLLSILLLLSAFAFGQAISGDIVGVVKDTTGAYVPSANIEATNLATGVKATTATNAQGEYRFVNLLAGHYSLAVTAAGMKGGTRDVEVELNKVATANITTSVAGTSTTVEVSETAVSIDSTTPTISTTFTAKEASDLPTVGSGAFSSGVLNLSLLNSGVASTGGVGVGSGPSVGGNRPRNNNFTVEGVDNNSLSVTGPLILIPNDAVDSFSVLQNQFSAEFGHSSGGQFNQTIKSGTNTFHGRVYEYFQNKDLNAIDSQLALSQVANGENPHNTRYDNNRYGGQIGGPIIKNKLFFFTDWEYNTLGQSATPVTYCAPTAAGYTMLAGLFPNNTQLSQLQKYVPTGSSTSATACSNTIQVQPGVRSDQFTNAINIPVGDIGFSGPSYTNWLNTANSFDWVISQNDSLRGRLAWTKLDGFDTAASLPTFWTTLPQRFWLVTLSEYHQFGTNVNNEFRFGFNRYSQFYPVGNQLYPGLGTFPNLVLNDLGGMNIGPDGNAPQTTVQNLYQFVDNLSWVKGKHNFRFGGEFRWIISPQTFTQRVRGDYEWGATSDYLNDFSPNPTLAADFAERSSGNVVYYGNKKAVYWYANDEWRLSPTFTLNLGIRYEYTGEPLAATSLQPLNSISNVPGLLTFGAPTTQKGNFMPRVGIAWAPSPETSVRLGFAMANDVIYDNLGILSLPPQVQQTCDTVPLGQPASSSCPYGLNNFLGAGGLPATPAAITDPATARAATSAFIPNQTLPYTETFTAGIQHVFGRDYTLEVRWVSTRGLKMPVQTRLNVQAPVQPWAYLPTYLAAPSQATLDTLPYTLNYLQNQIGNLIPAYNNAGFNGNYVVAFEPYGASKYNGLSVQFSRNFTKGLQFQFAYTWSHLLDNSTADVFSTVLTPRRPQDFQCFNCDYGTSALDHRHRVTAFAIYDLPFFKNANWFMKNMVGNWQFSPVYTFQSPEYATCQSAVDSNLNGDNAGDRCIYNAAGVPGTTSTVTALTNTAGETVAYMADNPTAQYITAGAGAFTTTARNTIATPNINNWDMNVLKRVNITERQSIEFQASFLNLFNHAQYVPGYISDVAPLGFTTSNVRNTLTPGKSIFEQWNQVFTNHPRQMVLVLKYNF